MSGGIAFVLDEAHDFARRCNHELVDLEPVDLVGDEAVLRDLLERHAAQTASVVAAALLADWPRAAMRFVKVMPRDYKRALMAERAAYAVAAAPREFVRVAHG